MTDEQDRWTAVDRYIIDTLVETDDALDAAVRASDAAGLPAIQVSPPQGKLLYLLARMQGARRILEVGTLGGYSTIWLARALGPAGRLVTLEAVPLHAEVARVNIARAGLAHVVDVRVGPALETMPSLVSEGPFDLIFVDANKDGYADYLRLGLTLSRPGTVMVFDNVVRHGTVADAASDDPLVQGVRRLNEAIASEPRVTATAIQTVGMKGYDGFALVLVKD